ncbi:MAG: hypothetical protein CTY10_01755 [Methylotenera sp.]|nr:MAG: hypothetical protein CTY10_01755 [Methylotenera sp.]
MQTLKNANSIWVKLAFFILASGLAFLFGLISVTANPILIGLAVGLVGGTFLLAIPKKTILLVIALGLATPALLDMVGHGFHRVLWAVSMMALLLFVPGLLNLFSFNPEHKKTIPLFIWLALIFMLYALIVSVSQLHGLGELFTGFKRYFQAFGLLLALVTMANTKQDFDLWFKLLLIIALLQLPFALFERFALVPLRGGLAAGGQATDVVAGTMGANLDGGSPNAIMVTFVLIAAAFVFSRWKAGLIEKSRALLLAGILLLPLVLGETKVVVVILPLLAFVLLRKDIMREPAKYIPVFGLMLILTAILAYFYVYILLDSSFDEAITGILRYNVQEVGYGTLLLNRTTVMTFWAKFHSWQDPITFLFGHGLGSSYGNGFDAGYIARLYPNYGINLTTISTLLWDLGVVGLTMYVSIFLAAWVQIGKLWRSSTNPQVKADCMALQAGIALTLFFLIYSDSQVNLLVHELIISLMLGYSAFLHQQQQREIQLAKKMLV